MAPISIENENYKLNQDKYDHDIHYIFKYETNTEDNNTSIKAVNFIPIFFAIIENPLEEFIKLSNKVFEILYPNQENSRDNDNIKKIKEIICTVIDIKGVAYTMNYQKTNSAEIKFSLNYILFNYFKKRAKHFHFNSQDNNQKTSDVTVNKIILDNPDNQLITTVITTTIVTTIVSKKELPNISEDKEAMEETLYEIKGVLTHELVHVWQYSCKDIPSNLKEGIADAVRLNAGYPAKHWVEKSIPVDAPESERTPWARGYEKAGFFLDWIQKNYNNTEEFKDLSFISALNKQCKHKYSDNEIKSITGYNIDELFISYQTFLISLNK
ncbi:BSP-domain-containing protein [Anaeromyces robustus]|uniref:BSP-domain-containing protein n=1 Tax=Anaeromyces robustus TaxID=1754192 RepID=A0A1Y1X3L5_9FUNG|nr:BSP-domain-containing protein [Anaeromyces robustus]|eukprot:ORX80373.1 BSP-domain-containing protein [Anaeromyces robustus]